MTASFITLGCRVNHYESEALAQLLSERGFEIVSPEKKCDVYIINTCAVTAEAVRKSAQMVRRCAKLNKNAFIGVMGCASKLDSGLFSSINGVSFVCGARNKLGMISAIDGFTGGNAILPYSDDSGIDYVEKLSISDFDRTRAYVKIQDGCDNRCSYCVINKVRGKSAVRDESEILSEVERLAGKGCREVVLTGIETASYGRGLLPLIEKAAQTDGIERIRLGSMEPSFLKKDFVDGLLEIPQFMPHIHVSVQSGSDNVLRAMRRKYNREMLENNLSYIRSKNPDFSFSGDFIVGFPGETEDDFLMTEELIRKFGFLHCHIFRYSKRPGTEAALMSDQVPSNVSKARLERLEKVAAEEKTKWLNGIVAKKEPVFILSETEENGFICGHSECFAECRVKSDKFEKGTVIGFMPGHTHNGILEGTVIK